MIRTAQVPLPNARSAPGEALLDPRLQEVWSRYARTTALALGAPAAAALIRTRTGWQTAGSFGDAGSVPAHELIERVQIGRPPPGDASPPDPYLGVGASIALLDQESSGALCVMRATRRRWSAREWEVLFSLADSLRQEIHLRLHGVASANFSVPSSSRPAIESAHLGLRPDPSGDLYRTLRLSILAAVHEGTASAGDRLPSIREISEACGTSTYAAVKAYEALEHEGVVEKRERSGIFIGSLGETPVRRLPETAAWLRSVITEGYLLQVKLPSLADLIQRWTAATRLKCVCVESSEDYRVALCDEVRNQFGLDPIPVRLPSGDQRPEAVGSDSLETAVRRADLVVTTPFHVARVRGLAARLDIPFVVATLDEPSGKVIESRVRSTGEATLVCVERDFADRMTLNLDATIRARVRIVATADAAALSDLDRKVPVLLTRAARQRMKTHDLRLLLPQYPSFSARFAERLAHTILQLNLMRIGRESRVAT